MTKHRMRVQVAADTLDEIDQKLVTNMKAAHRITAMALSICIYPAISNKLKFV